MGVMLWGDGAPLALTLDHADLWDLRRDESCLDEPGFTYAGLRQCVAAGQFDQAKGLFEDRYAQDNPVGPSKLYGGRAELDLGPARRFEACLDLRRALVSGRLQTPAGTCRFQAFVHRDMNVLCLRLDSARTAPELRVLPLVATGPELARLNLPGAVVSEDAAVTVLSQEVPNSPCYAVAWNRRGPEFRVALETAPTAAAAAAKARATWAQAAGQGFGALLRGHATSWRRFWAGSEVALPEVDLEFLWRDGLYLLACSSWPGGRPPGLQGVWAMDGILPPWRGDCHCDRNVQETFWPAAPSGHLELLDAWCDEMLASAPRATALTQRVFGTPLPGPSSRPGEHGCAATVATSWPTPDRARVSSSLVRGRGPPCRQSCGTSGRGMVGQASACADTRLTSAVEPWLGPSHWSCGLRIPHWRALGPAAAGASGRGGVRPLGRGRSSTALRLGHAWDETTGRGIRRDAAEPCGIGRRGHRTGHSLDDEPASRPSPSGGAVR